MASEENNGFGPIPRRRGSAWVKGTSIVFAVLLLMLAVINKSYCTPDSLEEWSERQMKFLLSENETAMMSRFLFICPVAVITLILSEAIRRLCLLMEERRHRRERYDGKLTKVIKATFGVRHYQSLLVITIIAIICVVVLWVYASPLLSQYFCRYGDLILANMAVACLINVFFSLKTLSDVEISELSEKDNLNVAHGLAWSYYLGYLKIILPELENTIAKSKWNDKMKGGRLLAKLFIVIPESCDIPGSDNLGEDYPGVKYEDKLPPFEVDRAGVKKRPYINSVYQVTDDIGFAYYCILEYATPVVSLRQMSNIPEAGLSAQDRHRQVQIFMRTLQEILDRNPTCSKRCVLVPISGEDYERCPLADVILKDIKQVK
ncbi:stimulator of interferon genes protein 2-like isoform X2 [Ptychodera flava]|uniref:stimulator of interferon genes protein 2-like isoform X2 n=1 Tax=Ptychodera flava TaxID=63121 RepID=UPI003969BF00